ncbi:hypothetical protein BN970_01344 [Mycolicibacterium conceptionense]|uniref:Uncharacterized protein n=1 Tax=Mycolicibacterium conceptionense TaxID=451644 RepID=A0A0U1D4R8_9MYCO|nr:hypothetical protein AWB98_01215 [Mycolicibacterium conceptionense]CQD07167.1 hypothetical protein BN970_01344 [Mycolicibacterium conceptionense]
MPVRRSAWLTAPAIATWNRLVCRWFGHRLHFSEYDPIAISHVIRCRRCGLKRWPTLTALDYPDDLRQFLMVDSWSSLKPEHIGPCSQCGHALRAGDWITPDGDHLHCPVSAGADHES